MFNCLTGKHTWKCPSCGTLVTMANETAIELAQAAGGCQGCRARKTLERKPELASIFIDFFARAGYPESDSWLLAIA